jgi:hypothetical protein
VQTEAALEMLRLIKVYFNKERKNLFATFLCRCFVSIKYVNRYLATAFIF